MVGSMVGARKKAPDTLCRPEVRPEEDLLLAEDEDVDAGVSWGESACLLEAEECQSCVYYILQMNRGSQGHSQLLVSDLSADATFSP